jgi:SAM-dependent methyltransferase
LAGIDDTSADVVISHVVFQHIPDPQITLGYVREIGRVLRPEGVTALVMSNLPSVHKRSASIRERVRALARRGPGGQMHEAWLGSAVELDDLRAAAADGGMVIEQYVGGGTQFMLVRLGRA